MKTSSYRQFDIVRDEDPAEFTARLNERLYELRYSFPDVTFSEEGQQLIARISYLQHDKVPEDLGDVYEMQNVRFTCQDCPMFKPILNKDGTPNLRVKYGKCQYADFGRTYKDSRCCDMLYTLLRNGIVQLVVAELED